MKRLAVSFLLAGAILMLPWSTSRGPGAPTRGEAAGLSADNLVIVSRQCMPNNMVALTISWDASGQGVQFVDIARVNNGFVFGTFAGVGPLPNSQRTLTLQGLEAGSLFFLRVNTLTQFGFVSSPTIAVFTDCQFVARPVFIEPVVFINVPFVQVPIARVAVIHCRQSFVIDVFGHFRRRLICI
jgi:hypothetical protein